MFVKVVITNRKENLGSETLYECKVANWCMIEDEGRKMPMLTLEDINDTKSIVLDTVEDTFHVFIMNNAGNTIDHRFVG